jgi:hypothetical protein
MMDLGSQNLNLKTFADAMLRDMKIKDIKNGRLVIEVKLFVL